MRGIIYVAHGSQKSGKNQKMQFFFETLKAGRKEEQQALAFLEKHPDTLALTARKQVANGVKELVIVPLLLFSALHQIEDIPKQLQTIKQDFPEVSVLICATFGQEQEVVQVLTKNIKSTLSANQLGQPEVLLVAHGSSHYPHPIHVVKHIGHQLCDSLDLAVTTGFLYGEVSYLEQAIDLLKKEKPILIVPFFLFDGHLLDKIKTQIVELTSQVAEASGIYYAPTLNLDISMTTAILRLVDQQLSITDKLNK